MSAVDLDLVLQERFTARAAAVAPTIDPGPAIFERSRQLGRRRRRRQVGLGAGAAAALVAAVVLVTGSAHHGTAVHTANGVTTTTLPGCAVSATCQPARVSVVAVGEVPASYERTSRRPPIQPNGQHVVELTYTSTVRPATSLGTAARQLIVRVATSSTQDADAIAGQVAGWAKVRVGIHPARATSALRATGTPAEVRVSYLDVRLSPTVTLSLTGEGLTTDQLISVALSITVR
jgi:hypothetical protein